MGKKVKDPSAPTAAKSSWILFTQDRRTTYREKFPDLKNYELNVKMGEEWKSLDATERKKFDDLAAVERENYKKELAKWKEETGKEDIWIDTDENPTIESLTAEIKDLQAQLNRKIEQLQGLGGSAPKQHRKRDPNLPKPAKSGWLIFSDEKRSEIRDGNKEMSMAQIMTELGKLWKSMSNTDKQVYLDRAEKDRERYESELAKVKPQTVEPVED